MPSKYSHSVVLAQQSSRGLISLPNEQYINYLTSSPLLTTEAPRSATAAPKDRPRAESTKTDGSEHLNAQVDLRCQISLDRLAASARQYPSGARKLHAAPRHVILDSEDEDDDEEASEADRQSETSRLSDAAPRSQCAARDSRQKRLPQRLPVEMYQQVVQNGLFSPVVQGSRLEQKTAARRQSEVRPLIDLPIQRPSTSARKATALYVNVPTAQIHRREISVSKSLATPQLSPTGTEMSRQDESPATPFSSLGGGATPAMPEEHGSLSRVNSTKSQNTRIWRPGPARMPTQANFDGFLDDEDSYLNDPPESPRAQRSRLAHMNLFPMRVDSFSSLSDLREFGMPSVSQTTGRPKTSAAAMQGPARPAHETSMDAAAPPPGFASLPKAHARAAPLRRSISTFRTPTRFLPADLLGGTQTDYLSLPPVPVSSFKRSFEDHLLDPAAPQTLLHFLGRLDSRFDVSDGEDGPAAPPPDIARRPPSARQFDALADLEWMVDSRGGVSNVVAKEPVQKEERKGIFRSLRIRGKKW